VRNFLRKQRREKEDIATSARRGSYDNEEKKGHGMKCSPSCAVEGEIEKKKWSSTFRRVYHTASSFLRISRVGVLFAKE
jgi:hypothetical protein